MPADWHQPKHVSEYFFVIVTTKYGDTMTWLDGRWTGRGGRDRQGCCGRVQILLGPPCPSEVGVREGYRAVPGDKFLIFVDMQDSSLHTHTDPVNHQSQFHRPKWWSLQSVCRKMASARRPCVNKCCGPDDQNLMSVTGLGSIRRDLFVYWNSITLTTDYQNLRKASSRLISLDAVENTGTT